MNDDLERRVAQLEQDVHTLTLALVAASRLSTTPPERLTPEAPPRVHGGRNIVGLLREGGLLGEPEEEHPSRPA